MSKSDGFKVTRRDDDKVTIVYPQGFLDAHTAPEFESELQKAIESGRVQIVVNCKDLDYISSAGLGVFMGCIEQVRELGGDIKISNLLPKVYHVFELLGFHQLYDLIGTEEEAAGKFAN
ncbi:MAG TPA: STAS domain-containing protein [Blastocatellia bacterium]|nr:STAS domain-containing protein [Blastocatellia bacterium]